LKPSVQSKRQGLYKSIYFMSQLPDDENENRSGLEGEEEVEYENSLGFDDEEDDEEFEFDIQPQKKRLATGRAKQTARKTQQFGQVMQPQMVMAQQTQAMRYQSMSAPVPILHDSAMSYLNTNVNSKRQAKAGHRSDLHEFDLENDNAKPKSPMETKQFLLHLLSTEILINTRLKGEFTCVHSEFDSWNPALPHSSIFSVLYFFGLSSKWLRFFQNFLQPPLKFVEDGVSSETRIRRRGAPGAHALSAVCGEAVLFCLDFAVNQRTNGAIQLHRLHDDFWLWYVANFR